MGWAIEQNTGVANDVVWFLWYKGHIYASTDWTGVWRRDGPPWTNVFAPNLDGRLWHWEADGALYCGDGPRIRRSVDGVNWPIDVDLGVAFGLQGGYAASSIIGGYGDYLYLANIWAGVAFFYRRDLAGNWAVFAIPLAAGGIQRGLIGFGGEVYYTTSTNVWYWDGAAWAPEATLDGNCGTLPYISVIDHRLYICAWTVNTWGYYWKTAPVTNWSWLSLPVPNNTWAVWPLCEGADGEIYTLTRDGTDIRIYQKVGGQLNLIGYEAGLAAMPGTRGGICVDATGVMYFGSIVAGAIQFLAFAGVYNVTPAGGGLYPQSIDADGDGDALYIGLYDTATAQPILISVPLPLDGATSTGNAMFQPGAGNAVNVKCTDVGDNLVVSGHFGANEQVETSDDAGLNWTDIDPGTWAANLAQPLVVAPTSIDEVMVALDALQDLYETVDGGTTWIANTLAIGFTPSAMDRMVNGTEMIIGDGAGNRIDYSPNRGVSTANVTGAFGGNVAALEIT